jgi:hypothetical protein
MTITVRTEVGRKTAQIAFKKGPDPLPAMKGGNLKTNVIGHAGGAGFGLNKVSDLANPFCWIDEGFCSATEETREQIDDWAGAAGADTGSSMYAAAWDNGVLTATLALGGGRFAADDAGILPVGGASSGVAAGSTGSALVPYNRNWAFRQQENFHIPQLVTPQGRTLSNHAAERVAGSGPGRPPTTLNALDYILENATKVKYDPVRDTLQVRATQLPGKPFVVVSGRNPNHIVTAMIPKSLDMP